MQFRAGKSENTASSKIPRISSNNPYGLNYMIIENYT